MLVASPGAWIAYDRWYGRGGDRPVAWRDGTAAVRGAFFRRGVTRTIESREELREVLGGGRAPEIDFARRRAVLVSVGPRSSPAYRLRVESVREERRHVVVVVRERSPQLGQPAPARVSSPFLLLTLPAGAKPVTVERAGRP